MRLWGLNTCHFCWAWCLFSAWFSWEQRGGAWRPFNLPLLPFRLIGFRQIPLTHLSFDCFRFLITANFLLILINFCFVIWWLGLCRSVWGFCSFGIRVFFRRVGVLRARFWGRQVFGRAKDRFRLLRIYHWSWTINRVWATLDTKEIQDFWLKSTPSPWTNPSAA